MGFNSAFKGLIPLFAKEQPAEERYLGRPYRCASRENSRLFQSFKYIRLATDVWKNSSVK